MSPDKENRPYGFTLIECSIVVAVLCLVALFAVVKVGGVAERAKRTAAEQDLASLRSAFLDPENGYLRDMRGIPGFSTGYLRLANLLIATNLYGAVADGAVRTTGRRVDIEADGRFGRAGCAAPEAFTRWDPEAERGWRGPYLAPAAGVFPSGGCRRRSDDRTAEERGFFPPLAGLRLPDDFLSRKDGCSVYGFPGEPAPIDPWGNPYVLQIPPPQAFPGANTNVADEVRFRYARVVSAGPDGVLETPCFAVNRTNWWETAWTVRTRRLARQAGRIGADVSARGDDLVLFLLREDVEEGEEE